MNNTTSMEFIKNLHKIEILPGPDVCIFGNKNLKIQKLSSKNSIYVLDVRKVNANYFIQ